MKFTDIFNMKRGTPPPVHPQQTYGAGPDTVAPIPPHPQETFRAGPETVSRTGPAQPQVVTEPPPKKERLYTGFARLAMSPKLISEVSQESGIELITAAEREILKPIDQKTSELNKLLLKYSHDAVRKEIEEQQKAHEQLLRDNKLDEAYALSTGFDKEHLWEDRQTRRQAVNHEIRRIREPAYPIFDRIASRTQKAAEICHAKLEPLEREVCAKYGWPFIPTPRLAAIGQLAWRVADLRPAGSFSMRHALLRFGIDL